MWSDRDNGGWSRDTTATLEPVLALVKLTLDGFPIVKFLSRLNLAVLLLVLHVSPALSQQAGSLDDLLPEQKHPPTRPFLCKVMIGTKAEAGGLGSSINSMFLRGLELNEHLWQLYPPRHSHIEIIVGTLSFIKCNLGFCSVLY